MAIYLSRKKGGAIATPITPSNSNPAQMTADTPVNPTANGYAIESYSSITPSNSSPATITSGSIYKASANGKAVASVTNVTPSSTPTSVSMDDVVHIQGSGVIVDAMPPTPTSLTPSNNTPANIASGQTYIATANGRAIESYDGLTNTPMNVSVGDFLHVSVAGQAAMLQAITPSNTNPPEIDYSNGYISTTRGYVVRDYDSVTPSSTPEAVTAGDMVQINGSGVIVDSIPTPTSLTPSNSSPATITSGATYTATANGKAVSSVTDITPSNSSPVSLSSGTIYKPSASGYAISSYSSKTPSDSSPASVSSGAIIKASSSGYLYSSSGLGQYVNITNAASKDETFNLSGGSTTSISVTSKPKLILWFQGNYGSSVSPGYGEMGMYDGIRNKYRRVTYYSGGGNTATDGGDITSVTSSSVSFKNNGSTYRRYHVMMWY